MGGIETFLVITLVIIVVGLASGFFKKTKGGVMISTVNKQPTAQKILVLWKFSIGGIIACLAVILGTYAWRHKQYASIVQKWMLKVSKFVLMIPLDVAVIATLMSITESMLIVWTYLMYRYAINQD